MSEDGTDRYSLTREQFNDLLTFDAARTVGTVDLVIRDDNDLLIFASRRKDEESRWHVRSYRVLGDGVSFGTDDLDRANVAAILVEQFDPDNLTTDERHATRKVRYGVPTVVAVDGKPAVCAWLYAAHERPREEIAGLMDVSEATVREYLSRFRRRGTGVPDDVDVPETGEHVPEIPPEFDPTRQQIVADGGKIQDDTERGKNLSLGPFEFQTPDRDCQVSDCDEKADGVVDMEKGSINACAFCAPQFLQHDFVEWTPLAGGRSLNPEADRDV